MMGLMGILKHVGLYLYLQLVGAWTILQEQIWDRHIKPKGLETGVSDRTIVITGGNRGIGFEAVKSFLSLGYHVIIGCRSPKLLEEALAKLKTKGKLSESASHEVIPLDLTSLESVRSFARVIIDKDIPIHVLANNAGIMFGPRVETKDGFESQFGVNYLGHFLLTSLLLPQLRRGGTQSKAARIVNVSSVAHYVGSWMNMDDLNCKKFYSPEGAYGNSKAAQILFTRFLDQKLQSESEPIRVHSVHPGVVNTGLYNNHAVHMRVFFFLMKTARQGGDSVVHAALSHDLEGQGGTYIENTHVKNGSSFVQDVQAQDRLWKESCKMLGIETFGE